MRGLPLLALAASIVLGVGCTKDVDFAQDDQGGEGGRSRSGGAASLGGGESGGRGASDGSTGSQADGGSLGPGGESGAGGRSESGSGGKSSGGGSADGAGGGSNGALLPEEFCDGLVERICDFNQKCYGRDCSTLLGTDFGLAQGCYDALAAVREGLVDFHGAEADACLDLVAAEDCSGNPSNPFGQGVDPCPNVFEGKRPLGDECAAGQIGGIYDDCAEGYCRRAQTESDGEFACRGTCVGFQGLGEACSGELSCESHLYCSGGKCVKWGQKGDDCTEAPCTAPLLCSTLSPRVCRTPGPVGSDCGSSAECESPAFCYEG
jgi:hypothetical protein